MYRFLYLILLMTIVLSSCEKQVLKPYQEHAVLGLRKMIINEHVFKVDKYGTPLNITDMKDIVNLGTSKDAVNVHKLEIRTTDIDKIKVSFTSVYDNVFTNTNQLSNYNYKIVVGRDGFDEKVYYDLTFVTPVK